MFVSYHHKKPLYRRAECIQDLLWRWERSLHLEAMGGPRRPANQSHISVVGALSSKVAACAPGAICLQRHRKVLRPVGPREVTYVDVHFQRSGEDGRLPLVAQIHIFQHQSERKFCRRDALRSNPATDERVPPVDAAIQRSRMSSQRVERVASGCGYVHIAICPANDGRVWLENAAFGEQVFAAHDKRAWQVRARDVEQMMGTYGW